MKKSHIAAILVLCAALLAAAVVLIVRAIPQKQEQPVTSLETASVFEQERTVVEPEREQAYEGELPEAVLQQQAEMAEEVPPEPQPDAPEILLQSMTEDEKLWQLFFVTPELLTDVNAATRAGESTKAALEKMPVGGILYFSQNMEDRAQLTEMIANTQSYSAIPLLIGVDEEGGTVSRLGTNEKLGVPHLGSMASYGKSGDTEALRNDLIDLASQMRKIGFNLDFAPVADVAWDADSVISGRAFGSDPALCASMVSAAVTALQEQNIAACLKHFPGYGAAKADDHDALVRVTRTADELLTQDLVPFAAGIDSSALFVMVSHLALPEVTGGDTPADLSPAIVTDLLRNSLGFSGVVITDAQNMESITDHYSPAQAAVGALQAGADMILFPADLQAAFDGVKAALQDGTLTQARIDESVLRVLRAKAALGLL